MTKENTKTRYHKDHFFTGKNCHKCAPREEPPKKRVSLFMFIAFAYLLGFFLGIMACWNGYSTMINQVADLCGLNVQLTDAINLCTEKLAPFYNNLGYNVTFAHVPQVQYCVMRSDVIK